MKEDQLYDLIQDHFDYLDALETSIGTKRLMIDPENITNPVMEFGSLDRDLYFVHDVTWSTNSGGIGSWIHSHVDDEGWIADASRAFKIIGHTKASEDIIRANEFYHNNAERIEEISSVEFNIFNSAIMNNEKKIFIDLHKHLLDNQFEYKNEDDLPSDQ
jgi:hypothetical protein